MPKDQILKRGFKSQAEKFSIGYREKLNVKAWEPLCAFKLAAYLSIPIYTASEILCDSKDLEPLHLDEWSALTMVTKMGNRIIVYNPFHSAQRQQSDLMHEIAHIICEHTRNFDKYDFPIPFGMHDFDEVQEEEAKCLGAALQLSKACLFWANKRSLSYEQTAIKFNSSVEMVTYRMNITGIANRKFIITR